MTRNLKALGLALVAVLAMSAMAASGAQADPKNPAQVTLGSAEGTIDATQIGTGTFTRTGRTVTCTEGHFEAHVDDGDTTITTTPAIFNGHCTGPLGFEATVDMNSCDFHFELLGTEVEGVDEFTATAGLECTNENDHAIINVYNGAHEAENIVCQYTFNETGNEDLDTIKLTNEPAGEGTPEDWVRAHIELSNIHSTRTVGSAFVCGGATDNEETTLEGEWELKGTNNAEEATGLTVSTHEA